MSCRRGQCPRSRHLPLLTIIKKVVGPLNFFSKRKNSDDLDIKKAPVKEAFLMVRNTMRVSE